MAQLHLQLPSEVWTHVFGHLSVADKFNVRASCKYFMRLVDHASLWKDWTVVLGFQKGSYNSQFWATLRHRKISSVVVRSSKGKDLRQLPDLTTVVLDPSSQETVDSLNDFTNMKHLVIRNSRPTFIFGPRMVSEPQQLTHLNMCSIAFSIQFMARFISVISGFPNLTSLVYHPDIVFRHPVLAIYSICNCLPKLKHLSLSVMDVSGSHRQTSCPLEGEQEQASTLSSLELVNCVDEDMPDDTMTLMSGLNRLAVFYEQQMWSSPVSHLNTWLHDLPQLSALVIVNGPPVNMYVASIPATVTSLTLCDAGLTSEDMAAVAVQLPNLLHLHIDPWPSHLGPHTAEIPKLFRKLKSLKLRHKHVPEKDFLHLHQLQDLEDLEVLDPEPQLSELIGKLKALTKYRVRITTRHHQRDVLSCHCVSQVY